MRKLLKFLPSWEWFLLGFVVLMLGLFVLGYDWFGFNGYISLFYAVVGGFIMAALIGPLVALIASLIAGVIAAVGIVVATLITPIVALGAGAFSTLLTWLAGTWIGTLFGPVYGVIAPIILKLSPLLTMGKWGHKIYNWLDDQPWWPQQLVFTANKSLTKLTKEIKKAAPKRAAGKRQR